MARIVVGSYMIRYPLGGMLSWGLQWLLGLHRLGHDVYHVEKSIWPNDCYDPRKARAGDDCTYGVEVVSDLLKRFGMENRWAYVDVHGKHHGAERTTLKQLFDSADLFLDVGTHGNLLEDAAKARLRVLVDGEPAFTQIKWEKLVQEGKSIPLYDHYFTNGANIGAPGNPVPTLGKEWRHIFNPVVVSVFPVTPCPKDAPFTTVMHWQSHKPVEHKGKKYGQKDVEFAKFLALPELTRVPLEVAAAGRVPTEQLLSLGWRVRDAQEVTVSFDSFRDYITASSGEFSVCKEVFVANNNGWFSDRSAAYLSAGRPVVMQDTGFSAHLPCGQGLFAVRTLDEAAAALDAIAADYERQSRLAHEVATEYLSAEKVLGKFLSQIGM